MDYQIVMAEGASHQEAARQLAETVNRELQQGWVPTGGMSFGPDSRSDDGRLLYTILQALTKSKSAAV